MANGGLSLWDVARGKEKQINAPEARTVRRKLATGAAGARLTEKARRTLGLIDSRNEKSTAPWSAAPIAIRAAFLDEIA